MLLYIPTLTLCTHDYAVLFLQTNGIERGILGACIMGGSVPKTTASVASDYCSLGQSA